MKIVNPDAEERPTAPERPSVSPLPAPTSSTGPVAPPSEVKLLLVAFRSGESVEQHPALQAWLDAGWTVRSAVPRIVESGDTKLLVVLERPVFAADAARPPVAPRRARG